MINFLIFADILNFEITKNTRKRCQLRDRGSCMSKRIKNYICQFGKKKHARVSLLKMFKIATVIAPALRLNFRDTRKLGRGEEGAETEARRSQLSATGKRRYSWASLGYFVVNLSKGQSKMY